MRRSELLKRSFIEMMKDIGTSIPGHIIAFDPDSQLAQVQIGVMGRDVNGEWFEPTPIVECPVYFFGGSDFAVEVQIDPGAEGVIAFSQRCIDGWRESGGVAANPVMRFHDFSDACFLPGLRSQVKKITGFQNNGIRLRNKDGSQYMWLKNDGTAEIKATDLNVVGNMNVTGVVAATDCKAGDVSLLNHPHGGVTPGTGQSGTPIPTPPEP